jgi:hypothetical protein
MARFALPARLILAAALVAGCADEPIAPEFAAPDAPQFGQSNKPGGGGGGSTESDPTATFILPNGGFGLGGDGKYLNGGESEYAEKVCGVHSKIFATAEASNSGDAIMHTSNPKYRDRKCPDYPRKVSLDYDGNGSVDEQVEVFINLGGIHNTTYYIPLNETREHRLNVNPESSAVCDGVLVFNDQYQDTPVSAKKVYVTRTAGDRWLVRTDNPATPDVVESGTAYCSSTGAYHTISVQFMVVSSRLLSPE